MLMTPILCYGKYRISSLRHIKYYPYAANSLPYAVKGDFNGDGIPDMVLAGHDNDANITVVLMSSGTTYYPITIGHSNIYETARKYGVTLKIQPTELLILKPRNMRCDVGGDSAENWITFTSDGFAVKEMNGLFCDSKENCRFYGSTRDFKLYQWQSNTGEFKHYDLDDMSTMIADINRNF